MAQDRMSAYERRALADIQAWKEPSTGWMSSLSDATSKAWNDVTDLVHRIPGVEWTMDNVIAGLVDLTNEITQDSVWTDAVYRDFRKRGFDVQEPTDVRELDLEHIDEVTGGLEQKYIGLATAEGAATGLAGAAGIAPDLIALVSINLRAAGEYAAYCGFDVKQPVERVYALELLDYVASSGNNKKEITIAPAVRSASKAARTQGIQLLEQVGVGNAVEALARRLGIHLTEKKMAQMVPVTGAFLGGGLNYLYTRKVCQTARFLYRERFLIAKYGPGIVEAA
ncbi:MAG: EcsC family protein [Rhodothermales bacterium]|nr:EcsC family protein [Rhodothermales bacterium]